MQIVMIILGLVLLLISSTQAFVYAKAGCRQLTTCRSSIVMKTYPVKLRNVITKMKEATQAALSSKLSRIEIELPPSADYGVEKGGVFESLPELEKVKRSNREAARLFTEMFSMLSSTTCVLFTTEAEARAAKTAFKGFSGQCLSIDSAGKSAKGFSNLRSRRFTAEEQEAALLGSDGVYVPDDTELLIIPGPRAKDFKKIKRVHEKLGDGTLIILLNARVDAVEMLSGKEESDLDWVRRDFKPVFFYCPPIVVNSQGAGEELQDHLQYFDFSEKGGPKWYIAKNEGDDNSGGAGLLSNLMGSNPFKTLFVSDNRLSGLELRDQLEGSSLG